MDCLRHLLLFIGILIITPPITTTLCNTDPPVNINPYEEGYTDGHRIANQLIQTSQSLSKNPQATLPKLSLPTPENITLLLQSSPTKLKQLAETPTLKTDDLWVQFWGKTKTPTENLNPLYWKGFTKGYSTRMETFAIEQKNFLETQLKK